MFQRFARALFVVSLVGSLSLLGTGMAHAADLNVPSTAYPTIQSAIDAASNGDVVLLANGTYTGTGNKDLDFGGKAITVKSVSDNPATCIIDCEGAGRGFYFHTNETATSVVRGITIQNGKAVTGGGMYNYYSSPTIIKCDFTKNTTSAAAQGGGGMYNVFSSPTVTNCNFTGNSTFTNVASGGGMYNVNSSPIITNCNFTENNGQNGGGGMYNAFGTVTVTNCNFTRNTAPNRPGGGGGMFNNTCTATVTNCNFTGNSGANGGGMYNFAGNYPNPGTVTVTNCTYTGNSALSSGGGMFNASGDINRFSSPTITNCTFTGNTAAEGGGMCSFFTNAKVTNCTFTKNTAAGNGSGMSNGIGSPSVTNCIFWGDTVSEIYTYEPININGTVYVTTPTISYSDVQGGLPVEVIDGGNNLNVDPLFVDAATGNLRLKSTSPGIDTGNDNAPGLAGILTDLDGGARIRGAHVDMGAYELASLPSTLTSLSPNSTEQGRKAFTLTVTGTNFAANSVVQWNGSALPTTFVSSTSLTVQIPAALVAISGKFPVTVVKDGAVSNALTFTVHPTTLKLTGATVTKDASGNYNVALTLRNVGNVPALAAKLTQGTLGGKATTTILPISLGDVAAGASISKTLVFPSSAEASGSKVTLSVRSTFTGYASSSIFSVTLP